MKHYFKKVEHRLRKGNGEFLAFSVVSVLICTIAIYFIAIIQMSSCMDDLSKAVTAASRVAAIDENLKDAKKDALDIAKYQLKRNSAIKKVSVEITYPVKNEWTSGNYILVTVKAKIKTIAPIKTKIHLKSSVLPEGDYDISARFVLEKDGQDWKMVKCTWGNIYKSGSVKAYDNYNGSMITYEGKYVGMLQFD